METEHNEVKHLRMLADQGLRAKRIVDSARVLVAFMNAFDEHAKDCKTCRINVPSFFTCTLGWAAYKNVKTQQYVLREQLGEIDERHA